MQFLGGAGGWVECIGDGDNGVERRFLTPIPLGFESGDSGEANGFC